MGAGICKNKSSIHSKHRGSFDIPFDEISEVPVREKVINKNLKNKNNSQNNLEVHRNSLNVGGNSMKRSTMIESYNSKTTLEKPQTSLSDQESMSYLGDLKRTYHANLKDK